VVSREDGSEVLQTRREKAEVAGELQRIAQLVMM
jgi:hypothetical protein